MTWKGNYCPNYKLFLDFHHWSHMLTVQSLKNNTHTHTHTSDKNKSCFWCWKPAQTSSQLSRNSSYYNEWFKKPLNPAPPIYLIQRENQNKTSLQDSLHTLILKALLNPLAKNPPNGPINEANVDSAKLCIWNGYIFTVSYKKNN